MKNIIYMSAFFCFLLVAACTDLDVPIESDYTADLFPATETDYLAVSGSPYIQMREAITNDYFQLQEFTTDEAVLTARGADYYDGGRYMQLNLHTWNETHPIISNTWAWGYKGISLCNHVLSTLQKAPDGEYKTRFTAEMRAMRALYYFMMMDLFGNIAIAPEYGSTALAEQKDRAEIFDYIEGELKAVLPDLSKEVSAKTYGRPTQWMAWGLLAKLYINAGVYAGQDRYTDAVLACNAIINADTNGDSTSDYPFALETLYMKIFDVDNGPHIKEIVFAVPFDQNFNANGMRLGRFPLHSALRSKFGLPTTISVGNCLSTWGEFYSLYNEVNDVRHKMWLVGQQYDNTGAKIKDGKDENNNDFYVAFTPEISFKNLTGFDRGTLKSDQVEGARNIKYTPDPTWTSNRDSRNDFIFLRYADILLMKAEAMLRGGIDNSSTPQTPLELVNAIRTIRNTTPYGTVDLALLFEERSREMAFEGWRRNDLIRFGKWEDRWGVDAATGQYVKVNQETFRRIFPIPVSELNLIRQNPQY